MFLKNMRTLIGLPVCNYPGNVAAVESCFDLVRPHQFTFRGRMKGTYGTYFSPYLFSTGGAFSSFGQDSRSQRNKRRHASFCYPCSYVWQFKTILE